ncbi:MULTISPECIES: hypothetical protein [unclassified Streptomyces]|uniref:hypothetical protein n=1 Tax=unclassified Streptomyces TaxID=2593676 RepID=UPI001488C698|nr:MULTISPECIES: hypothetical protein [unclassified Streptomyces]
MIWLLAFAVAMGVLLAVAVIADHWPVWSVRRQLPPIGQPVRAVPPPLPPSRWGHADHPHTRLPGPGRHRAPGGTP